MKASVNLTTFPCLQLVEGACLQPHSHIARIGPLVWTPAMFGIINYLTPFGTGSMFDMLDSFGAVAAVAFKKGARDGEMERFWVIPAACGWDIWGGTL